MTHLNLNYCSGLFLQDIEADDYEDLVIIMSQKARSSRGFGFQTSGGYDERKPLVVSSVSKGMLSYNPTSSLK